MMSGMVLGGDLDCWVQGHNHIMQHLDEHFINSMVIRSLIIWTRHLPVFQNHCDAIIACIEIKIMIET